MVILATQIITVIIRGSVQGERMFEDRGHLIVDRRHSREVLFALSLDPLVPEYVILVRHICWLSWHHCSLFTVLVVSVVMAVTARAFPR